MRGRTLAGQVLLGVAVIGSLLGSAPPAAASGPWVWPLAGPHTVSRTFDPPSTPYGPGHRGADLPGRVGDPVRAAGPGRISYAGLLAGRGVVVVSHGDLRTTYEPVSAVVRVGQQVAAGQVIGQLAAGHAGCRPACLHWGLLRGTLYLDPVRLITRGPSVLLPVDAAGLADAGAGAGAGVAAAGPAPAQRSGPAPSAAPGAEPRPAGQPAFALRSGDAASAGGALAALVAGLLLLRGPPRPPRRPASPAGGAPTGPRPAAASVVETRVVGLIDLASERRRRRREVA